MFPCCQVPLPDEDARAAIFSHLLTPHQKDASVSPRALARSTEGYSGADVMVRRTECVLMGIVFSQVP
jgi:SpoVK/Ycf46/Vps4 family AAA+-type ATPase